MRIWIVLLVGCAANAVLGQSVSDQKSVAPPAASTSSEENSGSQAAPEGAEEKSDRVIRTEKEWRKLLTREQFRVLRMKGTERPFTNKYDRHFEPGMYLCAACGQELFSSETKFNSGCGWPAFYAAQAGDRVVLTPDRSHGMIRTEVTCARCGSHLGHIFADAPQTPTGQRFCINSLSLKFIPAEANGRDVDERSAGRKSRADAEESKKSSEVSRRSR
ncbi:MAG: peptide-methionine (R)-S-oxide reductase MsrB [Pirellulaceae bacterium]